MHIRHGAVQWSDFFERSIEINVHHDTHKQFFFFSFTSSNTHVGRVMSTTSHLSPLSNPGYPPRRTDCRPPSSSPSLRNEEQTEGFAIRQQLANGNWQLASNRSNDHPIANSQMPIVGIALSLLCNGALEERGCLRRSTPTKLPSPCPLLAMERGGTGTSPGHEEKQETKARQGYRE